MEDPEFDRAIAEQDKIHPDDWHEMGIPVPTNAAAIRHIGEADLVVA